MLVLVTHHPLLRDRKLAFKRLLYRIDPTNLINFYVGEHLVRSMVRVPHLVHSVRNFAMPRAQCALTSQIIMFTFITEYLMFAFFTEYVFLGCDEAVIWLLYQSAVCRYLFGY